MSDKLHATTDDSFQSDVLSSDTPVLVDFWATWCGPCKAMAPHLETLADELTGKIKIVKVNVDENQATGRKYGIRSLPTLVVFKGGEVVDTLNGNPGPAKLREFVGRQVG